MTMETDLADMCGSVAKNVAPEVFTDLQDACKIVAADIGSGVPIGSIWVSVLRAMKPEVMETLGNTETSFLMALTTLLVMHEQTRVPIVTETPAPAVAEAGVSLGAGGTATAEATPVDPPAQAPTETAAPEPAA